MEVYIRRSLVVSLWFIFAAAPISAADRVLVCFGDSITAGYGLPSGESYPDALQRDLDAAGYHYHVVNRGINGATSQDAVEQTRAVLALRPEVVIVEFGGNDGLRGLAPSSIERNLDTVVSTLEAAHVQVLLAGITLPPDYGIDYIHQFEQVYRDLATKRHTAFVPMIYKKLLNIPGTLQADGIHPTAKGSELIAETLLPVLEPVLRKDKEGGESRREPAAKDGAAKVLQSL